MNKLSSDVRDSLIAFRDKDDNIRDLLCRKSCSEGTIWAIKKFKVLRELLDSETCGKRGEELASAKKKVENIINNQVFKYVEDKYMLDQNGQVVLRHAGPVIPLPTNSQQQQQQQLFLPSSNPFSMVPMPRGIIPFPITQNISYTVNNRPVINNVHHHNGANQESINKINENIEGIRKEQKKQGSEQKKQGKDIGDLKLSHTNLKTTVHNTLKKKPLRNNQALLNCTTPDGGGKKLFVGDNEGDDDDTFYNSNSFVEDAVCDSLNHLVNDSCRSPTLIKCKNIESSSINKKQESIPAPAPAPPAPWLRGLYEDTSVGIQQIGPDTKKINDEAGEQQESIPAPAPPAPWLRDLYEATSVGIQQIGPDTKKIDGEAGEQQETIPAPAPPAPWLRDLYEDTSVGVQQVGPDTEKIDDEAEKQQDEGTAEKIKRPVSIPNNPNVKSIVLLGETNDFAKKLLQHNSWDFLHLDSTLKQLHTENPEKAFYLFQGPAYVMHRESNGGGEAETCPTLAIILVPHGETPPEFVLKYDPENVTKEVIPFEDFGVEWKTFSSRRYGKKVFALKQRHGELRVRDLEPSKLWTLQGDALSRKDNETRDLNLTKAIFEFQKSNGETIREWYTKGMSSFSNICRMHGMVIKNERGEPILNENDDVQVDPEEIARLKMKIKQAFDSARAEREGQITMLSENYPNFASHSVVKVFPQNEAVLDSFRKKASSHKASTSSSFFTAARQQQIAETSPFSKLGYINEWYGTAETIVPDPMKFLKPIQ